MDIYNTAEIPNDEEINPSTLATWWGVPSVFIPEKHLGTLVEITPTLLGFGVDSDTMERYRLTQDNSHGMTSKTDESDFDELTPNTEVFFTGITGFGFANYHYRWFIHTKDISISVVLPCANLLADEESQIRANKEIANANELIAIIYDAYKRLGTISDKFRDSSFQMFLDDDGLRYRFLKDENVLEESSDVEGLLNILQGCFPKDILAELTRIYC